MPRLQSFCLRPLTICLMLFSCVLVSFPHQQTTVTLRGRVNDELGGLIVSASVTAIDSKGAERSAITNERGEFVLNNLEPGLYVVRVAAAGFALYENGEVNVGEGKLQTLDIRLRVELKKEEVAVGTGDQLTTDAENNRSATILRGAELDALPDDPDDLLGALQALAGPAAGPIGGQILIDGFTNTGQPLPPRATIREIRINQNPFSADNDRLGFGQIQIFTRPGTDRWRGEAVLGFSDESLNSRNPFALNRAPYQTRQYSGNISGPIVKDRATLIFNIERREIDAVELDANNEPVLDASGQTVLVPITSIERYRRTLLFQKQGLSAALIRERGGGATQFSITGGSPLATGRQLDFGAFLQDDWRVRPHLNISLGLRYESQTNSNNGLNLAPRISFAWAPAATKGAKEPQTVIRGGFGIFYDRFNENIVVTASRYNNITQRQFVVTDTSLLDLFPRVPSFEAVASISSLPQLVRRITADLHVPYLIQSALSLERQLPYKTTLTLTFINSRTRRAFRSRNVNAPIPGTVNPNIPGSGIRPEPGAGNILQFEANGRVNQNQLLITVNNRFSNKLSFFVNYTLSKTMSDTEGLGTFPANSYDLSGEYSRSSFDARHSFSMGGNFPALFGLRLNPLVIATSGRPFNIITGRDQNGDTLFTDRPAFATALTKPGIIVTRFGAFDPNPVTGQQIIPRNFAQGPGFFVVNLNLSRTFSFGVLPSGNGRAQGNAEAGSVSNTAGNAGASTGAAAEKRYSLIFTLRAQNIFNRTNGGQPIGNLSSSLFGQSVASAGSFGFGGVNPSAGNRRLEAQIRFTF